MRAAVLGHPVGHSLSPLLHNAAHRALGLADWTYEAIDCAESDLPALLAGSGAEWAGFSVTMPLKRAALAQADLIAPGAREVGAANTLIRTADGWCADNTDVDGIVRALQEAGAPIGPAVLLGAGGAAQAAVVALARLGVRECRVLVRDAARAAEVTETGVRAGVTVQVAGWDAAAVGAGDLVLSAVPAHAADEWAERLTAPVGAVLDMVYAPWPTVLAERAGALGAVVVGGRSMLLHQAARQVELMTGHDAPLAAMRTAFDADRPASGGTAV
jgi:shikimate dehydrogenase